MTGAAAPRTAARPGIDTALAAPPIVFVSAGEISDSPSAICGLNERLMSLASVSNARHASLMSMASGGFSNDWSARVMAPAYWCWNHCSRGV